MSYCEKCGAVVIEKETRSGSYSNTPIYFDEFTGYKITHTRFVCPNQNFWGQHTEFFKTNYSP